MKKQFIILLSLIAIFVIANEAEAKIISYDYNEWNESITLNVDGFISAGQICDIPPEVSGISFNNPSDLYNVVINNVHVFGGADISGTTKNTGWKVVGSCSDSEIVIWMLYFGNLGIGKTGPFNITVGNSAMSIQDEVTVCLSDTWSCGNWNTCSSQGIQTRICNITYDCPTVSTPSPSVSQSCTPLCTVESWSCTAWSACPVSGVQNRSCTKISDCEGGKSSPATTQSCTYIPPTCTSWTYSDWSSCSPSGAQTRSIISSSPSGCSGGSPILSQSCTYVPSCTASDWSCTDWSTCSSLGKQTRTCTKTSSCQGGASAPTTSQSCTYIPTCTSYSWSCGSWSACSSNGTQTRTCNKISTCEGGTLSPATTQSCTYIPPCSQDTWQCGSWSTCTSQGLQTRSCSKTYDCPSAETAVPATTQSCTPPQPTCTADTWTCNAWSACSLSGIQSRSCTKTYDCPTVETAPPITNQYCEAPSKPQPVQPTETDEISNQNAIIKSTVKLLCPVDSRKASQGSGTIIDSTGTILTNKHVIAGTLGCLVGFIDNYYDEPYFGERHIADIIKVSPTQDIAILKIRNPKNIKLTYVDITKGSSNLSLGSQLTTYGYPAKFGTKITYTSGDFSGTDGNYLKTTAILEYGNSGGGAYLKNGTFVGIPSAVVKGELNALGYLLSINTINAWLGTSSVVLGTTNNKYSRVSVLEDIDLNELDSLKLFIPNTDEKGDLVPTPTEQNQQEPAEQPQITEQQNESQDESVVIESDNTDQEATEQSITSTPEQPAPKTSWIKRFASWLSNLFNSLSLKLSTLTQ